jgi:hypothetical protein
VFDRTPRAGTTIPRSFNGEMLSLQQSTKNNSITIKLLVIQCLSVQDYINISPTLSQKASFDFTDTRLMPAILNADNINHVYLTS